MMLPSLDFESSASTNSAIPACNTLQQTLHISLLRDTMTAATCFLFGASQTEGGIIRRNGLGIKFGYNPVPE